MKQKIIFYLVVCSILMKTGIAVASYYDYMGWWYNGVDTAGPYAIYPENGPSYVATPFREGDVIFQRDLLTETNNNYLNSQSYLFHSTNSTYVNATEDTLRIVYGTSYSSGLLVFNSTSIRYRLNGVWSDWLDIGFSYQPPSANNTRYQAILDYDLKLEPYDAYEIKTNIINPGGVYSGTKQWTIGIQSVDQAGLDFDPLNPPIEAESIPEPASLLLLGVNLLCMMKKQGLYRFKRIG